MISDAKIKKINFYNHWHSGDVHVSRTFVYEISKFLNLKQVEYFHPNHRDLLSDCNDIIKHNSQNLKKVSQNILLKKKQ